MMRAESKRDVSLVWKGKGLVCRDVSLRVEDMQDMSRGQAGREPRTSRVSYTRVDQLLMYDLHYGIYTEPWNWGVSFRLNMPTLSKYIDGQRGSQQMVDSDGFIYSRRKPKDTPLYSAWICRKHNPPTKCPCHAYLNLTDNSLILGSKPHNHPADTAAPQRREVLSTLKRKAAEQPLSVTQNILSEVLADFTPETNQTPASLTICLLLLSILDMILSKL